MDEDKIKITETLNSNTGDAIISLQISPASFWDRHEDQIHEFILEKLTDKVISLILEKKRDYFLSPDFLDKTTKKVEATLATRLVDEILKYFFENRAEIMKNQNWRG